ncbi:MAG: family 10 glycosylhydrolase [Pseudanabaenaceae cyanobacterium bins.68]|nr:family 10 glycosylhydrolase [Pseudanabaenaceae cyanobacterium bins.68]
MLEYFQGVWQLGLSLGMILYSQPSPVPDCRITEAEALTKATLLQAAITGRDRLSQQRYAEIVALHSQRLSQCRRQTQPAVLGTWLRLYPCDLQPGALDQTLDNIVNFGYNRIYLNTFYDGRVLLPQVDNPTIWPSVLGKEYKDRDLLAEVIQKARQRGIKVHAWLYTMNFGPNYRGKANHSAIARNGYGETNLSDPAVLPEVKRASHIFIDPYSEDARKDLQVLIKAVAKRQPDGIAFDYIRYAHRTVPQITQVQDLMIYGTPSFSRLLQRAKTDQARQLLYAFLAKGKVDAKLKAQPRWWSFPPHRQIEILSNQPLNRQMWQLAVAHAQQGVIDFLNQALFAVPTSIPTSAVFFPRANQTSSNGVDPRLQPWPQFRRTQEWTPMLYAACGQNDCILAELDLVVKQLPKNLELCPVIAGYWGQSLGGRPALEQQMQAIYRAYPNLQCTSHFAYSWLDPQLDQARRNCSIAKTSQRKFSPSS